MLFAPAHLRELAALDSGLDHESRGEPIGIPCVVIVRVAVRVHIAEVVVVVVVIRRTLPPVSGGEHRRRESQPTGITETHP